MNDIIKVKGIILSTMPIGEYDKRLVIETTYLGKITAFARGCRRAGSTLLASTEPFVTGEFTLVPSRQAYRLQEVKVSEYFREIALLMPGVYIGFYFLDMVSYYAREGIEGTDMLNLLYVSLKALLNPKIEYKLIRRVFEMRLMYMNGEYYPQEGIMSESVLNICKFIVKVDLSKLYSFNVNEEVQRQLNKICEKHLAYTIDREPKSKKIMEAFLQ